MALLKIESLSINFGGIQALSKIDLDVDLGEILTIIGPNGSGKTTLFNCISGVYKPTMGTIDFKGKSLLGLSPDKVAKRGVARTFQNLRLFMHMTVLDNLMLGRHNAFSKNPFHAFLRLRSEELKHRKIVEELIDFLELQPYRSVRISDCPYGIQKRAEIGRALAMEPKLLMLDEPISGLTSEEKQETAYLITEIKGRYDLALLLVEHDLRIVSALADRMVAIDNGIKLAEGSPSEVQRHPDVIRAYVGDEDPQDPKDVKKQVITLQDHRQETMKSKPPLLRVANIETLYFDRIYALRGLTLTVQEGQIFAVLGPNGAGKTTLLKTVAGLLKDQPNKGVIELQGKRIHRQMPETVARNGIVFVPEDRGLFRELTVMENLEIGCWGRKRHAVQEDLAFVYELFPILKERSHQEAENLSGGQQQMLAVARAMLRRPKLLMLDEPSLGLAPLVAKAVYEALTQIAQRGTSILLVEQNAKLAFSIADYGYIMEAGRIVLEGTSAELQQNEDVQELYLGLHEKDSTKGFQLYKKRRTW